MTTFDRSDPGPQFEAELRAALRAEAGIAKPDYLHDALLRTVGSRQRPGWAFPERWLPMVDIAREPVLTPHLPWRGIAMALTLIAILVAGAWALIAGNQRRPPAPFGRAANGLVAYANGGDIYTADPVTGSATAIVRGPETDLNPRWSRDGTRIAFERKVAGESGPGHVYVARADGSGLTRVTSTPLVVDDVAFSPDGTELLISSTQPRLTALIAAVDGSGTREVVEGRGVSNAAWRPPVGAEILVQGPGTESTGFGSMRLVDRDGGAVRTLFNAATGCCIAWPAWSPDGSTIAYVDWDDGPGLTARTHVMAADGSSDRVLPLPSGAVWQSPLAWSNDGTRLLLVRGYGANYEGSLPAVVPVDGSGTGTEIMDAGTFHGSCCATWEWAPDDSQILGTPRDETTLLNQVLLDPVAGTAGPVPWESVSRPSWQRIAP